MRLVDETRVPWRYVHPQTDHMTFWPTPYVHPTFCPLWQFSTATLRPCDIFLLWHSDSVTIFYCDTSSMWHFATVTFWLCDNFLLWHSVSKWTGLSVHPKKWTFCNTVTFRPTVILANPWLWHFVHFRLIQVKKGGRPITVTKPPTFRGGGGC